LGVEGGGEGEERGGRNLGKICLGLIRKEKLHGKRKRI
jgi:hypothetical protein